MILSASSAVRLQSAARISGSKTNVETLHVLTLKIKLKYEVNGDCREWNKPGAGTIDLNFESQPFQNNHTIKDVFSVFCQAESRVGVYLKEISP